MLRDEPKSHATLSTATRAAHAARLRAPLSAANASLPHDWFRLGHGGFLGVLTFQLVDIFVRRALDTFLRTMLQIVNNCCMSPPFPSSSRGPARCAVRCAADARPERWARG